MSNKKLDIFRHRDFEELLTITYEFLKQHVFSLAKFASILVLPFIALSAIFQFDLLINKQLNIFEILNELKLDTAAFNPIEGATNLFFIVLYLVTLSVMGTLVYAYIITYKNGASTKKIKLTALWNEGKSIVLWLLLFNGIVFFLLSVHMYFLGYLNVLTTISYTMFIWGFTMLLLSFSFIVSSNIIAWGSFYVLLFVFVVVPVFVLSFWLFIRCILLLLYSVPLKLEEPNLSFTQRLVKCYQLFEGEALKSWVFIHALSFALFFITYVASMPVYGLLQKIGITEHATISSITTIVFKCFSYGLVVLLSGLMHLAISISFYSLYAKIAESSKRKSHLSNGPLGYKIYEN